MTNVFGLLLSVIPWQFERCCNRTSQRLWFANLPGCWLRLPPAYPSRLVMCHLWILMPVDCHGPPGGHEKRQSRNSFAGDRALLPESAEYQKDAHYWQSCCVAGCVSPVASLTPLASTREKCVAGLFSWALSLSTRVSVFLPSPPLQGSLSKLLRTYSDSRLQKWVALQREVFEVPLGWEEWTFFRDNCSCLLTISYCILLLITANEPPCSLQGCNRMQPDATATCCCRWNCYLVGPFGWCVVVFLLSPSDIAPRLWVWSIVTRTRVMLGPRSNGCLVAFRENAWTTTCCLVFFTGQGTLE